MFIIYLFTPHLRSNLDPSDTNGVQYMHRAVAQSGVMGKQFSHLRTHTPEGILFITQFLGYLFSCIYWFVGIFGLYYLYVYRSGHFKQATIIGTRKLSSLQ